MKLGTKLPPGLINLPKTCLCFPPRRYETLPTSCPKEGGLGFSGSHAVDCEEAAFKVLGTCASGKEAGEEEEAYEE